MPLPCGSTLNPLTSSLRGVITLVHCQRQTKLLRITVGFWLDLLIQIILITIMFKVIDTEYTLDPLGAGSTQWVRWGKSPKAAMAANAEIKCEGISGTPILMKREIFKGSKLIYTKWDD